MQRALVIGHAWTIYSHIRDRIRPPEAANPTPWQTSLPDGHGVVRLSGVLHQGAPDGAAPTGGAASAAQERRVRDCAVVIVHGLGGCHDSGYVVRMASAATRRGFTALRLSLRGADRLGEDFYHAGLTSDLEAALASPELSSFLRLFVVGFSLGGHVTMRLAASPPPRLTAIAAVCSPLSLSASCDYIDRRRNAVYRRHLLSGLREMYRAVADRRPVPEPPQALVGVRTLREWDDRVVAPRFGFHSAQHYYDTVSVAPLLEGLEVPSLLVAARADPMVPVSTVTPFLPTRAGALNVVWVTGGHVGFPKTAAVEDRVLDWFERAA